jgi:formin 2
VKRLALILAVLGLAALVVVLVIQVRRTPPPPAAPSGITASTGGAAQGVPSTSQAARPVGRGPVVSGDQFGTREPKQAPWEVRPETSPPIPQGHLAPWEVHQAPPERGGPAPPVPAPEREREAPPEIPDQPPRQPVTRPEAPPPPPPVGAPAQPASPGVRARPGSPAVPAQPSP